jgi:hypothetical protein
LVCALDDIGIVRLVEIGTLTQRWVLAVDYPSRRLSRRLQSLGGELVSHPRIPPAPLLLPRWRLNDPPSLSTHRRELLAA